MVAYSIDPYKPSFVSSYNLFQNQSSFHCPISLDPFAIFHYEALHNLHLVITNILLRLVHVFLGATTVRPSRPLNRVNAFFREVETIFRCTELNLSHSVTSKRHSRNVWFTKSFITKMLEASQFRQIDKLLPLGTVFDPLVTSPPLRDCPVLVTPV